MRTDAGLWLVSVLISVSVAACGDHHKGGDEPAMDAALDATDRDADMLDGANGLDANTFDANTFDAVTSDANDDDDAGATDSGADAADAATLASLRDGLLGAWSFDGDGDDHSGNGLNLEVTGLGYQAGEFGSALTFAPGTTGTAKRPIADPSLALPGTDFTISAWVQSCFWVTKAAFTMDGTLEPTVWNWVFGCSGSGLIAYHAVSGQIVPDSGSALASDRFEHVMLERSGDELHLYRGGALVGTRDGLSQVPNPSVPSPAPLELGYYGGRPVAGKIDDLAIWNRALTAEERTYLATHPVPTEP